MCWEETMTAMYSGIRLLVPPLRHLGQWHFQPHLFLYPNFTDQTQINMQSSIWYTTAWQWWTL